ncbi:flagellar hook capping protein [Legionella israelensis]|uniref:Basal-body rod modification protein FlgD n=3 Tax=Legionella israelensis TaxID=454 RepID=A0AAX1EFY7_9GAMM|nr:flagellar hook capping FlgD N-terminal domain-containing protein [Legionella israelensis]QBR83984.1 flagellar hook capping protein [Legionella israelensis]
MTDAIESTSSTSINQADYLKLFMQELTYQDPLKPVDNKEFMAQMAQFSMLQEAQASKELLSQLLGMTSANQALNLLGKKVKIKNSNEEGYVTNVLFSDNDPPRLSIGMKGAKVEQVILNDIEEVLSQESFL